MLINVDYDGYSYTSDITYDDVLSALENNKYIIAVLNVSDGGKKSGASSASGTIYLFLSTQIDKEETFVFVDATEDYVVYLSKNGWSDNMSSLE